MDRIPVFIIDDQKLFRQSLALLINSIAEFRLAGDFEGGRPFLSKLPEILEKESEIVGSGKKYIALVDMGMPGMNGIELNKIIQDKYPQIKVVVLSVDINPLLIAKMIDTRASSYMAKNCDKSELINAITSVYNTGFYYNHQIIQAVQASERNKTRSEESFNKLPVKFSARERQVLQLICLDHTNAEIAAELHLSVRTIEGLKAGLLTKTSSRNSAGLILFAIKNKLFNLSV